MSEDLLMALLQSGKLLYGKGCLYLQQLISAFKGQGVQSIADGGTEQSGLER